MPLDLTPKQPPYYELTDITPISQPQLSALILGAVTQSGTDIPTATYGINNSGATITFTRGGVGQYTLIANQPIFTSGKTFPEMATTSIGVVISITNSSTTQINFNTAFAGSPADNSLTNTPFRISVYE